MCEGLPRFERHIQYCNSRLQGDQDLDRIEALPPPELGEYFERCDGLNVESLVSRAVDFFHARRGLLLLW